MPDVVMVHKDKLLKALKENQQQHEEEYEEALDSYHERVVEAFKEAFEEAKDSSPEEAKDLSLRVGEKLTKPHNHSEEYQAAIDMISWEISDEIKLRYDEFQNIVRDEWSWKHDHRDAYFSNTGKLSR